MMKDPNVTATIGAAVTGGRHASLFLTVTGQGSVKFVPVFKDEATEDFEFGYQQEADLKTGKPQTFEFPMPDNEKSQILLRVDFAGDTPELLITSASVATDAGDEGGCISIVRQTANQVDLHLAELPGPRVLLFVDSYFPGWTATVNGKEVPILPADNAFKAVVVPAGSSEVHFAFSSKRVTIGMVLACVAIILVVMAILNAAWVNRRRNATNA
jgi:hypothetical protein